MAAQGQPLIVIGHKNPDTDSICAAIAYARLKTRHLKHPAIPYRAGNLNAQTAFVLARFGVATPDLATNLSPRIADIMLSGDVLTVLRPTQTLGTARRIIAEHRWSFVPVAGEDRIDPGKVTAVAVADALSLLSERPLDGHTLSLPDLVEALSATGPASGSQLIPLSGPLGLGGVGDPAPSQAAAVVYHGPATTADWPRKAAVVVWCQPQGDAPELPQAVVRCAAPPLRAAVALVESLTLAGFLETDHKTFQLSELVRDVQREVGRYNEGGFLVVDEQRRLAGVIQRISFLNRNRFPVALVDHNERAQCVDGIDEAEIVEIIDHHRIGAHTTDSPITFINRVVGSTCTIIADLYHQMGCTPEPAIAGLMLSAILSDTVILRSPTTTDLDRQRAAWLADLAGVELAAHGEEMFAAGANLAGREPAEVVSADQKEYAEGEVTFAVSQVELVGFNAFYQMQESLSEALDTRRTQLGCDFACLMVTDISQESSLLLCRGRQRIVDAISYPEVAPGLFEMREVLSRKKQVLPYLLDLLRGL